MDAQYLKSLQILYSIVSIQEHSSTFKVWNLGLKYPHLFCVYLVAVRKVGATAVPITYAPRYRIYQLLMYEDAKSS